MPRSGTRPCVCASGSWLAHVAILILSAALSYPSQPQPEPCRAPRHAHAARLGTTEVQPQTQTPTVLRQRRWVAQPSLIWQLSYLPNMGGTAFRAPYDLGAAAALAEASRV
eukprot:5413147-Prymnesium_polylepis.2